MSKYIKAEEYSKWDKNLYKEDNELTPLEAFKRIKNHCENDFIRNMLYGYEKELKIVETALKTLDKLQVMHANALTKIANDRKKLKALEIIKENIGLKISIDEDVGCLYVQLDKDNICIVGYVKGKDKVDLLKEVLL